MKLHPTILSDSADVVPEDSTIWCIGTGFTTASGIDSQHAWTARLALGLNCQIINVSTEYADNNWIEDQTCDILKEMQPAHIIVQWSYFNAYPDSCLTDFTGHIIDINQRIIRVETKKKSSRVTHSFVPDAIFPGPDKKLYRDWVSELPKTINVIGPISTLDLAGDGYWPGPTTHQAVATIFQRKFTNSPLINNNWM